VRRYLLPPEAEDELVSADAAPMQQITLKDEEFHYLVHVLRYTTGSRFEAIDRRGRLYQAEIGRVHTDAVALHLQPRAEVPHNEALRNKQAAVGPECTLRRPCTPEYTLYQALLKGKKMETVLRQAAAAGIHHIVPLQSDHAVAKLEDAQREKKKRSRWEAVLKEAIQQSGSSVITRIHPTTTLQAVENSWRSSTLGLFFHQVPLENGSLHRYLSSCPQEVALFIGPEGGFSPAEVNLLHSFDCRPVYLHTNVLRAETAAIYAIGAVQTIVGEKNQWKPVLQSPEKTDTAEYR